MIHGKFFNTKCPIIYPAKMNIVWKLNFSWCYIVPVVVVFVFVVVAFVVVVIIDYLFVVVVVVDPNSFRYFSIPVSNNWDIVIVFVIIVVVVDPRNLP